MANTILRDGFKNYKIFWTIIIALIICIAVAVGFLTNPKTNNTVIKNSGSDLEGLSVEVVLLNDSDIGVKWINDTENEIVFGEEFYILKYKNGKWKDCRKTKEYAWNLIAYSIRSLEETEHKYSLADILVTSDGIYRFESDCFIDGKPKENYKVWAEFEIKNGRLITESFENDGEVFFYKTATDEHENPTIVKYAEFGNGFKDFLKTLETQKWTDDYLTDRISFDFNGKISCFGDWIYFSYDQKVVYYDHYFSDVDNKVIESIKKMEEKAVDYSETTNKNQNPYFNATVLEVYENSVLVEPFKDEEIRENSDKISVSTEVISTNPLPELKKGMQIRVVYNGVILESYPASLGGVFAIYELDKNGEVIFKSALFTN